MRVKQHTARAYVARHHVAERLCSPKPVTVADFGYLSRTYHKAGGVVRTTRQPTKVDTHV